VQFLTAQGCKEWLAGHGKPELADRPRPREDELSIEGSIPTVPGLVPFCRIFEHVLQPYDTLLLWVTARDIWSENLHMYYRLRESYGDRRLLPDAPGHLFLEYEAEDARTFLQVCLANGWDAHLFPFPDYGRGFVSHDEYWEASFTSKEQLEDARGSLKNFIAH
jgi:hypothetical protein